MRKALLSVAGAGLVALSVGAAWAAEVNCGIVNKDLAMGRTKEDISERMMISVEDVEKCQDMAMPGAGVPGADEVKGTAGDKPAAAGAGSGV